jgi:hypothetical protein
MTYQAAFRISNQTSFPLTPSDPHRYIEQGHAAFTPDTVSALLQHFRFEPWSSNVLFVPKIKPYSLGTGGKLHDFFGTCSRTAGISAYTIAALNLTLLLLWCHPDWSFDGCAARAMILKQNQIWINLYTHLCLRMGLQCLPNICLITD